MAESKNPTVNIKNLVHRDVLKGKGYVASYKKNSMVDGVGVRNSIYATYCPFHCVGCYNKSIQPARPKDKETGEEKYFEYTKEFEDEVIADLLPNYVHGVTLLGGEPLLNLNTFLPLSERIREEFGYKKSIWSWTGYTYDELMESVAYGFELSKKQYKLLQNLDVLVDGRFEQENFIYGLTFRGSSNQRIIDVQRTLALNGEKNEDGSYKVILWKDGAYLQEERERLNTTSTDTHDFDYIR